jgi:peptide/nickel transport system substrate-binding protein
LGAPLAAEVTCQILPRGFPGYRPYCPTTLNPNPQGTWSHPNIGTAQKLVAHSGTYGDTVVVAPPTDPINAYLASLLHSLGYRTQSSSDPARWTAYVQGWNNDYPAADDFIGLFSCQPGYCHPTIDRGIKHALRVQAEDPSRAGPLWARLDHRLTQTGSLWVPLLTALNPGFTSRRVGNYQFSPAPGNGPLIDQMWVR